MSNYNDTSSYVNLNRNNKNNPLGGITLLLILLGLLIFIVFTDNALGNTIREKVGIEFYFGKKETNTSYYKDNKNSSLNETNDDYISPENNRSEEQQEMINNGYIVPTRIIEEEYNYYENNKDSTTTQNSTSSITNNNSTIVSQNNNELVVENNETQSTNNNGYLDVTINRTETYHQGNVTSNNTQSNTINSNSNSNSNSNNTNNTTPIPTQKIEETYEIDTNAYNNATSIASNYQDTINEILDEINVLRTNKGLDKLTLDNTLCNMAGYRAYDMATKNYFSHEYNGISQLRVVMYAYNRMGILHYENLGRAKNSDLSTLPTSLVNNWKNSSSHYSVMTNDELQTIGIAICSTSDDVLIICSIYSKN